MTRARTLDAMGLFIELRRQVEKAGGASAYARKHGLSVSYLHDVLGAITAPGPLILDAMGLRKVVRYVKARKPKPAEPLRRKGAA